MTLTPWRFRRHDTDRSLCARLRHFAERRQNRPSLHWGWDLALRGVGIVLLDLVVGVGVYWIEGHV